MSSLERQDWMRVQDSLTREEVIGMRGDGEQDLNGEQTLSSAQEGKNVAHEKILASALDSPVIQHWPGVIQPENVIPISWVLQEKSGGELAGMLLFMGESCCSSVEMSYGMVPKDDINN
ncbi:Hypothetical predicted protein [Marmota monax]|uniref:Uncharacterized protein n=1 Tax=Marmota monax TaxID=9995 RepID=A0A5E4D2L7_MARMO|nr:hypothetical protein GHT09_008926 [Marmota monax]VTJ88268.1 Hypothetical predicted protein [Marmota monax]